MALADAVGSYGNGTFFYVRQAKESEPPFCAVSKTHSLVVANIDRFAPQDGRIDFNIPRWERTCRAVLDVL